MKSKSVKAPTVLDAADHNVEDLVPHKGHFHTKDGRKVSGAPSGVQDKPPSDEDVMDESLKEQRRLAKHARAKTGSAHTMLQPGSGAPSSRSNKLL